MKQHLTFYSIVGRAALQKRIMALLRQLDRQTAGNIQVQHFWLCPCVLVHRGNACKCCGPFFRSLCLAVVYCWVHEDKTNIPIPATNVMRLMKHWHNVMSHVKLFIYVSYVNLGVGVRVCSVVFLSYFWCSFVKIYISTCGIAVFTAILSIASRKMGVPSMYLG